MVVYHGVGAAVSIDPPTPNTGKRAPTPTLTRTDINSKTNDRAPGLVDEDVGVRGEPRDDGGDVAVDLVDLVGGLGRGQQFGGRLPLGCWGGCGCGCGCVGSVSWGGAWVWGVCGGDAPASTMPSLQRMPTQVPALLMASMAYSTWCSRPIEVRGGLGAYWSVEVGGGWQWTMHTLSHMPQSSGFATRLGAPQSIIIDRPINQSFNYSTHPLARRWWWTSRTAAPCSAALCRTNCLSIYGVWDGQSGRRSTNVVEVSDRRASDGRARPKSIDTD